MTWDWEKLRENQIAFEKKKKWIIDPIPPHIMQVPLHYKGIDFNKYPKIRKERIKKKAWSGVFGLTRIAGTISFFFLFFLAAYYDLISVAWYTLLIACVCLYLFHSKVFKHAHFELLKEDIVYRNNVNLKSSIEDALNRLELAKKLRKNAITLSKDLMNNQTHILKKCKDAQFAYQANHFRHYWEAIEATLISMANMSDLIDDFRKTGEQYNANLKGCTHNLPTFKELSANETLSLPNLKKIITEYNRTLQLGETNFDFASYMQRDFTIKVLIAGFETLSEAIDNMGHRLSSAIANLQVAIENENRDR